MSNFSGYTPIYIRNNGNDISGIGTLNSPFLTAQKAFEYALFDGSDLIQLMVVDVDFNGVYDLCADDEWLISIVVGGQLFSFSLENYYPDDDADIANVFIQKIQDLNDGFEFPGGQTLEAELIGVSLVRLSANILGPGPELYVDPAERSYSYIPAIGEVTNCLGQTLISSIQQEEYILVRDPPGSNQYVLDFGVGSFGGINLNIPNNSVYTYDWPSRIAIRGVDSLSTFLGGINGNGLDAVFDYTITLNYINLPGNGKNINILGQNINLGNIITNAGSWDDSADEPSEVDQDPRNGGNITLNNVKAESIVSIGAMTYWGQQDGGNGGSITLINTNCNSATSLAEIGYYTGIFGQCGPIALSGNSIIPNYIALGTVDTSGVVNTNNLKKGRGINGSNILGLI